MTAVASVLLLAWSGVAGGEGTGEPESGVRAPGAEDFFPRWGRVSTLERSDISRLSLVSLGRALRAWPGARGALAGGPGQGESMGLISPWADDVTLVVEGRSLGTAARSPWGLEFLGLAGLGRVEISTGMISSLAAGPSPGGMVHLRLQEIPRDVGRSRIELVQASPELRTTRGEFSRFWGGSVGLMVAGEGGRADGPRAGEDGEWGFLTGVVELPFRAGAESRLLFRHGDSEREVPPAAGDGEGAAAEREKSRGSDLELTLRGRRGGLSWQGSAFWSARSERRWVVSGPGSPVRWQRGRGAELRLRLDPSPAHSLLGAMGVQSTRDGRSRDFVWALGEGEIDLRSGLMLAGAVRWEGGDGGNPRVSWALGPGIRQGEWRLWGELGCIWRPALAETLLPREIPWEREEWWGAELTLERGLGDRWRAGGTLAWRKAQGEHALLGGGNGGPGVGDGPAYVGLRLRDASLYLMGGDSDWAISAAYFRRRVRGERSEGPTEKVAVEPVGELRSWCWGQKHLAEGDLTVRGDLMYRWTQERCGLPDSARLPAYSSLDLRFSLCLMGAELFWLWENSLADERMDRPGYPLPPRNSTLGISWVLRD